MPEIQTPEPGQKLQRLYSIPGNAPAPTLAPEIVPVVIIDDATKDENPQAFSFPRPAIGALQLGASVGERNEYVLLALTGTNLLVTVHRIVISFTGQQNLELVFPTSLSGFVAVTTKAFRDTRLGGAPSAFLGDQQNAGTTAGPVVARQRVLGNTAVVIDGPFILSEGASIVVRGDSDNLAGEATFYWSETQQRPL